MIGEIEVINSCMTLKLKKNRLSAINDDALFLPDIHQTEKDLSQWNLVFADIFLSHCIKKGKNGP